MLFPLLFSTILLFLNTLVTSDIQYNFQSSKSIEDLLVLVPNLMEYRPWPNDIFNTVYFYDPKQLNYLRFASTAIWIVYKGNDTSKPVISEVNVTSGASVHTIVTQLCDEGGFSLDPYESAACNGVGVRDAISNYVYGVGYTSTRSTATLQDYVYRRSEVITIINNLFQYHHYLGTSSRYLREYQQSYEKRN